jgi:hypothetical protein
LSSDTRLRIAFCISPLFHLPMSFPMLCAYTLSGLNIARSRYLAAPRRPEQSPNCQRRLPMDDIRPPVPSSPPSDHFKILMFCCSRREILASRLTKMTFAESRGNRRTRISLGLALEQSNLECSRHAETYPGRHSPDQHRTILILSLLPSSA